VSDTSSEPRGEPAATTDVHFAADCCDDRLTPSAIARVRELADLRPLEAAVLDAAVALEDLQHRTGVTSNEWEWSRRKLMEAARAYRKAATNA
jgi:hypothetical protein